MKRNGAGRRRPAVHITLARAARLHRLVTFLAGGPRTREELLGTLAIGLRTFYRELELLRRCGVRVRLQKKAYVLQATAEEAEGRLPFPDPQLSFAEMAELSRGPGEAARRLAGLLASVVAAPAPEPAKGRRPKGGRRGKSKG
jgi:predicted DNA-binding transcriptional regulator YafY